MNEFFGLLLGSVFDVLRGAATTAKWWLPIVLVIAAIRTWIYYVQLNFRVTRAWVLLEIKVPREITKSPLAMETALASFHQTGREATWYARYILGKSRPWFSLELVSIGGTVRFFVRTETAFRPTIEAALYAQYPTIELHEAPDYTQHVPYKKDGDWSLFGVNFKLSKEDAYPIKTYIDYNLDQDPKEELKIDPLLNVLEFLGSLKRDEQMWIQILIRATKDSRKPGGLFGKKQDWKEEGKVLIKEMKEKLKGSPAAPGEFTPFTPMTKGETEVLNALERNISKLGFDTGIRTIYLAKGKAFRPEMISGMVGVFKQFNSNALNGFGISSATDFNYPWQDYKGIRLATKKAKIFNAYVRRSWFHPPYKKNWFVLNQEELATLFHFPGRVAETPSLERIESKRSEPPPNLPI